MDLFMIYMELYVELKNMIKMKKIKKIKEKKNIFLLLN